MYVDYLSGLQKMARACVLLKCALGWRATSLATTVRVRDGRNC